MLEANHTVGARAVAACPPLAGRILVVGDLRADRLLRADQERDSHRAHLGISGGEVAVLFITSFGPAGMLGRHGWGYVDAALELGSPFRVLVCIHPHIWCGRRDNRRRLFDELAPRLPTGLVVCGPDEDFAPYLAAGDIAVIDHGSLGLYWSLLARPTVTVPVPPSAYNLASPVAALRASSPTAASTRGLRRALEVALATFDPSMFGPHRAALVAWPGQAAAQTRAALYGLLGKLPVRA
jgi:hypothetical protein